MPTTVFTINTATDLENAIAAISVGGASSATNTAYTINFNASTVTLASQLNEIDLAAGSSLTINGNGDTLSGNDQYEGFFVASGTVSIDDLMIANAEAVGGGTEAFSAHNGGGGGGAGLGGGLFVGSGASVTLTSTLFTGDSAKGGNGNAGAGGSGGGLNGGGGGGTASMFGGGGGFGGGGAWGLIAGGGGFGGGGGRGFKAGDGGFGGGSGASNGSSAGSSNGGGGLGAGGDIFVQQGGALIINGATTLGVGTVSGGSGYQSGDAFGNGLFIQGNQSVTLAPGSGQSVTMAGVIADQNGAWFSLGNTLPDPGTSADGTSNAGVGTLDIGAGSVALTAANTFAGPVVVQSGGEVQIAADDNLGIYNPGYGPADPNVLTLDAGSTLDFTAGFTLDHPITVSGDTTFVVDAGTTDTIASLIADGATRGSIELEGGGALVLAADNSYSGFTRVDSGSALVVAAVDATGTHSVYVVGGTLTNEAGALTSYVDLLGGSVSNDGTILGNGEDSSPTGINVTDGGTLTNQTGGLIDGGNSGNVDSDATGVITDALVFNAGTILGSSGSSDPSFGLHVTGGLSVNTGVIEAGSAIYEAIGALIQGGTLVTSGTIMAGTAYGHNWAVDFTGIDASPLVVDPGAVFVGEIHDSTGQGVIELAGTSAGTLGGSLAPIVDVGTIDFESGSQWSVSDSAADFASIGTLTGFAPGDTLDVTGVGLEAGGTFSAGNVLTLTGGSGSATLAFDPQQNFAGYALALSNDGAGGTDVAIAPAPPPVITGTEAGQTTQSETPVMPFATASIIDTGIGATDTLTITLSGSGGSFAAATGLIESSATQYTLTASASTISSALEQLVFTPNAGQPDTANTTGFTLSDQSDANAAVTTDSTTTVIDNDPAVAPTITGTEAGQTTTSEMAINPFGGVTISDANSGATDSLTITQSGGGTLSGSGLVGSGGTYTLTGSADVITSELDSLTFTPPTTGAVFSTATTSFTLSDESTAYATAAVDNTTSVLTEILPPLITLVAFNGNGYGPNCALIEDANGDLFGTTLNSGKQNAGDGEVFEIAKSGSTYSNKPTVLLTFNFSNGALPFTGLLSDSAGDLFAVASAGGSGRDGTVVELVKSGSSYSSKTLANFNGTNGNDPLGSVVSDSAGDLFGTTAFGGAYGDGEVYEIAKSGSGYSSTVKLLASFDTSQFSDPEGSLLIDASGDLFGLSSGPLQSSSTNGYGGLFEVVDNAGTYSNTPVQLAAFDGSDGAAPVGNLIADSAGDLFGLTTEGGPGGGGEVFELVKTANGYSSTPYILYGFSYYDGYYPVGGLIADAAGNLYGTTFQGGPGNSGEVFELAKTSTGYSSTLTLLAAFNNEEQPYGGLIADAAGDLFGTTTEGGAGYGTVFEITNTGFVTAPPGVVIAPTGTLIAGQTLVIATITPPAASDGLLITSSTLSNGGTLSLRPVSGLTGVENVVFTAPTSLSSSVTDSISFTVTDQTEYTTATASTTVALDAGPKISGTGKLTIGHGQTQNVTSVIDSYVTSGLPGDAITITSLAATHGTTVLATDSYTAPASGTDTLTYKVANQYGQTATGTIAVTIDPGPTLTSSPPSLLAVDHSAVIGTVTPGLANDNETLDVLTAPSYGTLALSNGAVTYSETAALSIGEIDSFRYDINDAQNDVSAVVSPSITLVVPISATIPNGGTIAITDAASVTPFGNVVLTDANIGQTDSLTLSVTGSLHGTLNATTGGTLSGGVFTATGSPTQIEADLAGLVFTPNDHAVAPGQTQTTGFSAVISDTDSQQTSFAATIIATAVNDPPTITGAIGSQPVSDESTIAPLAAISVTDPDFGVSDSARITLSGNNGTLSGSGLTLVGPGTYALAATAPASLTGELRSLVFTPTPHLVAPGSTIATGFTLAVTQGSVTTTDSTTSVIATAVNDPPVITGTKAGQATGDETAINPFAGVTISDVDVGVSDSARITLSNTAGTLTGGGLIANAAGVYTLAAASPASLTTELRGLVFTPTPHLVAPGSTVATGFTLAVTQGNLTTTDSITSVIATAVNDPPVITGTKAGQATTDEASLSPFSGVTITDPDDGVSETVSIYEYNAGPSTLTLGLSDGTLSGAGLIQSTTTLGLYILTGSPTLVTQEIDALSFTPTAHQTMPGQGISTDFTLVATQNGASTYDSTTSLVATAVNDAPVISGATAGQTTTDERAIDPFSGVVVGDVDVGVSDSATIILSNANGTLSGVGLTTVVSGGTYTLAAAAPATLTAELDALVFTPTEHQIVPGSSITTGFTLEVAQNGVTAINSTTSVVATAVASPITLAATISNIGTIGHVQMLVPFSNVMIGDPNAGETETATVVLTNALAGSLSLPGGVVSGVSLQAGSAGTYTLSAAGSASMDAALDALVFTPATPAAGGTAFDLTVKDSSGEAAVKNSGSFAVDPGPTAKAVSSSVKLGGSIDLTGAILAAVTPGLSGDKLTITADDTASTLGAVSLANGDLVYAATGTGLSAIAANGTQSDSFTYTVSDEYGDTASGTVTVAVSNPADLIYGGIYGNSTINGTAGADIITAYEYNNIINDNGGNDIVYAGDGQATVNASTGNVVVDLSGYYNSVTGGNGNDTVTGAFGNTAVVLGNGSDTVNVGGYYDTVTLGNGNDTVTGPLGNTTLTLGSGVDVVDVSGYDNNIKTTGTAGTDYINAGLGNETITGGNANYVVLAGGYSDTVTLGNGNNDVFTTPSGVSNPSLPTGTAAPVEMGLATVTTGSGSDTILLSGFSNLVNAGGGMNFITGGTGLDTFVLPTAGTGMDTISNFTLLNGDALNVMTALSAAHWNGNVSTLGNYLKVSDSGGNAMIGIATNAGASVTTIAQLNDLNNLTLATLQPHLIL